MSCVNDKQIQDDPSAGVEISTLRKKTEMIRSERKPPTAVITKVVETRRGGGKRKETHALGSMRADDAARVRLAV